MIKAIIFDIGKVLISFDWQKVLADMGLSEEEQNIVGNAMFQHPDWAELDRGVMTVEEVMQRFISHAPQYEDAMRQAFFNIYSSVRTYPYSMDWLRGLKEAGYRLYYLSNYGEYPRELSRETLRFTELMDGGIFSYQLKILKPSPWIYLELMKKYNIQPEEAVFIDDSAVNVEGAKTVGLHTILFTSYENTLEELKKLGVQ